MVNPIKGHVFIQDNGDGTGIILEASDEAILQGHRPGDSIQFNRNLKTRSRFNFGPDKKIIHYTDLK